MRHALTTLSCILLLHGCAADQAVGDEAAPSTSSTASASAGPRATTRVLSQEEGAPAVGEAGSDVPGTPPASADKPLRAVTADFLNRTLSIVDVNKLTQGAKRSDALIGTVDLAKYSPGPLSLAITPDGKTALVSVSAGFLGAFISVPAGRGTLLFVDLETRTVTGELNVGNSPMGIAITPDGKRAFVGLFSESYFAEVDIDKRTYKRVPTGGSFNEEFAIDDTGTVGIMTYGPSGNAKTFNVDNPSVGMGQTNGLSGDAAGVAFFPGTKIAYLMQAPTTLTGNRGGHNLVDVTNPRAPVALDNVRISAHPTTYPVTAVHARRTIAFPATKNKVLSVVEMKLEGRVAKEAKTVTVGPTDGLAYGITEVPDGKVLVAVSGEHYIGVVDLETGKAFTVPWEVTKSGPTEIKMIP